MRMPPVTYRLMLRLASAQVAALAASVPLIRAVPADGFAALALPTLGFAMSLALALGPEATPGGAFAPAMALRRAALPVAALAALVATALTAAALTGTSLLLDADGGAPPPGAMVVLLALHALTAAALIRAMTAPGRILRTGVPRYRGNAAASRASASMAAQSPAAILSFGATQLPPTHSTFGRDR